MMPDNGGAAAAMRREAGRFSRYGVIGIVNNLALYLVFVVMIRLKVPVLVATGLCYVLGVGISYALNRRFAFKGGRSHRHDLPRFIAAYGIGLGGTILSMAILVRFLPPELAQIVNIVVTACIIYATLRLLKFGEAPRDPAV